MDERMNKLMNRRPALRATRVKNLVGPMHGSQPENILPVPASLAWQKHKN